MRVGETGVGKMGAGEAGVGETGVGKMGVGEAAVGETGILHTDHHVKPHNKQNFMYYLNRKIDKKYLTRTASLYVVIR